MASRVLLKIACLLMHWLFSLAVLVIHDDGEKNAEVLALRHEKAVLRRNAGFRVAQVPGCLSESGPYRPEAQWCLTEPGP